MTPLTAKVERIAKHIFRADLLITVLHILETECGTNLPLCDDSTPEGMERLRFAALKVSNGDMSLFREAIDLAKLDWRDLLVWAQFADDLDAHNQWAKSILNPPLTK
jgi:hypothetical protein